MAAELFEHFDADGDGFWNRQETSNVQMATSETEMSEDSFVQLILTTAPEGGRFLSEEDLQKGLSREKVVDLYTDREMQRRLGFVLDVRLDHATVFFGTSQSASTVQRRTLERILRWRRMSLSSRGGWRRQHRNVMPWRKSYRRRHSVSLTRSDARRIEPLCTMTTARRKPCSQTPSP